MMSIGRLGQVSTNYSIEAGHHQTLPKTDQQQDPYLDINSLTRMVVVDAYAVLGDIAT